VEAISAGAEMSTTTNEQIPCKKCGGVGFTREAQKGQLLDKRVPCADCVSSGKVIISVETKFIP
jgi:DnaJ-class molecular chaperone